MELVHIVQPLVKAAGTAGRVTFSPPGYPSGVKWIPKAIRLEPNTTSATNGTNYATLQAYVGSTAITGTRTTESTSLTAGTGEDLAITGVGTAIEVDGTSDLSVRVSHAASGVAVDVSVAVTFEVVRY